ncbi:hypothetical protein [Burkholderia anthina]|uniref:hypothetical protein n=1 Tax=Burkholderia anthina TaxID=179879 RepID=UPI001AA05CB6|nr:hypothetical protein [Burkholderia anthina]QTD95629.1 hypothetical protein J4G50_38995 [Burkholderia anthina]QTD95651.1 hypothetical protein J4G50_39125 [Burkholderia anthina]
MPKTPSSPLHSTSPLVQKVLAAQAATHAAVENLAMLQERCAQVAMLAAQGPTIDARIKDITAKRQDIQAAIAVGECQVEALAEFDAQYNAESKDLEQQRVAVKEASDLQAGLERKVAAKETEISELRSAQRACVERLMSQAIEQEASEYVQATQQLSESYRKLQGLILAYRQVVASDARISLVLGVPEVFKADGIQAFESAKANPYDRNKLHVAEEIPGPERLRQHERWRAPVLNQLAQLGVELERTV